MTYQELIIKLIEIQKHMMPDLEKFEREGRLPHDLKVAKAEIIEWEHTVDGDGGLEEAPEIWPVEKFARALREHYDDFNDFMRRNIAAGGAVEVSSNIGVVITEDAQVTFLLSPRSSIASLQEDVKDRIQTLADAFGFDARFENEYPGWSYTPHSHVRDVFQEAYRELFGTELKIESIHAGLECGLFAEALPGLDAIAVGPTLSDVHTPDESMELASSERFYELLVDVLARLAK